MSKFLVVVVFYSKKGMFEMVVYFAGDGQLGNQIFQYMLLRSRFRRSYIVSRNFLEIKELFSNVSRVINIKKMNKSKFLTRCFRKLINLRIIGHCYVERTEYFGFPFVWYKCYGNIGFRHSHPKGIGHCFEIGMLTLSS